MTLVPGTKLGPYEIVAPLGAGGMGEVYRARDTRLGRDIAIKVLPASFSKDPERLHRFEQEARATSALNHPNILAIYDIGQSGDSPYVVSELLEGETMGERLRSGAVSQRKSIEYAVQMARGLAAAHEKGIVHRDLKPENLFITREDRVKILDFGLAKLTRPETSSGMGTQAGTVSISTEPGKVMGTVGYMSPEQVRGEAADHRTDIFSFGTILYEMLAGHRAFQRDTMAETMTAILKEEPAELMALGTKIAPSVVRVVDHCLEKLAELRFQSAKDLAFALEALSGTSTPSSGATHMPSALVTGVGVKKYLLPMIGVVLILAAGIASYQAGKRLGQKSPPAFTRLSFRRGHISSARFAPDGQTVVYSGASDGAPLEILSTTPPSPESRGLGFTQADLMAISATGQMALSLKNRMIGAWIASGTLAVASLTGGAAPRSMLEGVEWADWSPDGKDLAVVRQVGAFNKLEYPIGNVLDQTSGWFSHIRMAPAGRMIAYIEHQSRAGDPGSIDLLSLDSNPNKKILSTGWNSAYGLAWSPDGKEIWFTATTEQSGRALHAVSLSGQVRLMDSVTGNPILQDVAPGGRVLLTLDNLRTGLISLAPGSKTPRDLSWLDFTALRDMSGDGNTILFDEAGEAGGEFGTIYLRKADGSPPVRLSTGLSTSLSPDGQWVLALEPNSAKGWDMVLLPAGPGEPRIVNRGPTYAQWSLLSPDGNRIVYSNNEPGHGVRLYVQSTKGGPAQAITDEGVSLIPYAHSISPDGKQVIAVAADQTFGLYSVETGQRREISGLTPGQAPIGWTGDGRSLYVYQPGEIPAKVYRLDLATGRSALVEELVPPDPAGVTFIRPPHFSSDGKSYAYSYTRILSDLYLAEGLK